MRNKERDLAKLIKKYVDGRANSDEKKFIELYYREFENFPGSMEGKSPYEKKELYHEMKNNILKHVLADVPGEAAPVMQLKSRRSWIKYAAAASVLVLVAVSLYFSLATASRDDSQLAQNSTVPISSGDIAPGGNKATLLLDDGTRINLDEANQGHLSTQGNANISKPADGQLAYQTTRNEEPADTKYNTVMTPRGGQYNLILADGSKVWLNSSSSIRFPATFNGHARKVEITGEVYFEIAKNAAQPFIVSMEKTEIKVYGTHFNINSYEDESAIKTTLLEGSVEVISKGKSMMLAPGEEASITHATNAISKKISRNAKEAIAWKEGYFQFDNANIQFVMRQLARWYDLKVLYEGTLSPIRFKGKIQRNLPLSDVLEYLKNDVHFERMGNTIIIKP